MDDFLGIVARSLYERYGDKVGELNILFPGKRASVFLNDKLGSLAGKPLWMPSYISIGNLARDISGIGNAEKLRVVAELYKIYNRYFPEPFDSFYFWGETMLSDFDSVDKYMVDAAMLFRNIADLKELEKDTGYLTPEQRAVISNFWRSFGPEAEYSDEKEKFVQIWNRLLPIYNELTQRLTELGFGYEGLIYRAAAEKIRNGYVPSEPRTYVVAGFNALSASEKIILDHLAKDHETLFFWDHDLYYTADNGQEAGLFLRENIARYGQHPSLEGRCDNFAGRKNIVVTSVPSDSLQAKYTDSFIREVHSVNSVPSNEGYPSGTDGRDTAVVLTDENLLMPVLYSMPGAEINVTMGYPISSTNAYTLVERIIGMQTRARSTESYTMFNVRDLRALFSHPFLRESAQTEGDLINSQVAQGSNSYSNGTGLNRGPLENYFYSVRSGYVAGHTVPVPQRYGYLLEFHPSGWDDLAEHLVRVLRTESSARPETGEEEGNRLASEKAFVYLIIDQVVKLGNIIKECGIDISVKIYGSLLRKVLQGVRVPFSGEPLRGIQVMGILETRNIDFKNVLLLSVSDDTFPGNRLSSPTFIPYNLRVGYGLPTPAHHDGVYAYYFYRLLQRAENIHIVYSSRSDDRNSGERSRYIYQLEFESPHSIVFRQAGLSLATREREPLLVERTAEVLSRLDRYTGPNGKILSPTAIHNYITCPLKFYFANVEMIRDKRIPEESIDAPTFGTILHRASEIIYTLLAGHPDARPEIERILKTDKVREAVDTALREVIGEGTVLPGGGGISNLSLVRNVVLRYLKDCILPFDRDGVPFEVLEIEKSVSSAYRINSAGRTLDLKIGGTVDRLDRLADGSLRIVDYKTGTDKLTVQSIEGLFGPDPAGLNSACFQTLLYAGVVRRSFNTSVRPSLYYVRKLRSAEYQPYVTEKSTGTLLDDYDKVSGVFEPHLQRLLTDMFDPGMAFSPCQDNNHCEWCDYRTVCGCE